MGLTEVLVPRLMGCCIMLCTPRFPLSSGGLAMAASVGCYIQSRNKTSLFNQFWLKTIRVGDLELCLRPISSMAGQRFGLSRGNCAIPFRYRYYSDLKAPNLNYDVLTRPAIIQRCCPGASKIALDQARTHGDPESHVPH
jgi:hypothetical protein